MSTQEETVALAQAARTAGLAPSIHNSQPWRWRVERSTLDLRAERARQLAVTDPLGRMLTISCGAALHHARLALAAEGWTAEIQRMPDEADADLLARITVTGRTEVTPEAMRKVQTAQIRHTDRRPLSETTVDPSTIDRLRIAAEAEGTQLHVLGTDGVLELASAATRAQSAEGLEQSWREEMRYWAGNRRDEGLGIPDDVIPSSAPQTTVPGRDFGRGGTLRVGPGHDQSAAYAILFGDEDTPVAWLRAGEALSAVWIESIELNLSLVPLSAAAEVPVTRHALRRLLSGVGEPYLALRLGIADQNHAGPAHTPRLPIEQVVEIVSGD